MEENNIDKDFPKLFSKHPIIWAISVIVMVAIIIFVGLKLDNAADENPATTTPTQFIDLNNVT